MLEKERLDAAPDSDVQRPISSQKVNLLRWSDQTLLFSVRSNDVPASGRAKTIETGWTELWLRPVSCDRTRQVVIPGVLDISGIDRTLGGSVRSLPQERLVNRKRA